MVSARGQPTRSGLRGATTVWSGDCTCFFLQPREHVCHCPDCTVEMRAMDHEASTYSGDPIRIDAGSGVPSALDLTGDALTCYVCPECGLAGFYAET